MSPGFRIKYIRIIKRTARTLREDNVAERDFRIVPELQVVSYGSPGTKGSKKKRCDLVEQHERRDCPSN
jgi:hypothetical protein